MAMKKKMIRSWLWDRAATYTGTPEEAGRWMWLPQAKARGLCLLLRLRNLGSRKPFASLRNCFGFLSITPCSAYGALVLWGFGLGISFFFLLYQISLCIAVKLASYCCSVSQQFWSHISGKNDFWDFWYPEDLKFSEMNGFSRLIFSEFHFPYGISFCCWGILKCVGTQGRFLA